MKVLRATRQKLRLEESAALAIEACASSGGSCEVLTVNEARQQQREPWREGYVIIPGISAYVRPCGLHAVVREART